MRTKHLFISFIVKKTFLFFKKKKLFRTFKMNLSRNKHFLCFAFLQVFLPSFSHHFLFLFITFRIHLLFHFLLCLTFYFLDFFLLELNFFTFTFFSFLTTNFPLVKKTLQFITFYMRALPLYVLLLIHLFICCLFFSRRVFSFLSHLFPFSFCLLCP